MKQWLVLFQKEQVELWRNYKWIWVPVVFLLLGSSTPLSTYFMPQILEDFGGLPEGAVIDIPTPTGTEVLAQTLSDFGLLGVLVLTLALMGIVSGERRSGVAAIILLKPVPYFSYLTAKWAAIICFTWVSLGLGYGLAMYYTTLLFDAVSLERWVSSFFHFGLWLTLVMTIVLFYSTILKQTGAAAFCALGTILLISLLSSSFPAWFSWSPAQLANHATLVLLEGEGLADYTPVLLSTLFGIIGLQLGAIAIFTHKELVD